MNYLAFLEKELHTSADIALKHFGNVNPRTKLGDNNQVLTEADLDIGQHLAAVIQATYPDHNVIDEEAGVIDKGSRYSWVVDPIEATSNFAAGIPEYGIMVGLLKMPRQSLEALYYRHTIGYTWRQKARALLATASLSMSPKRQT